MADVYYDSNAVGGGTGADWANAFTTLAAAIAATITDTIWMASDSNEGVGNVIYTWTGQKLISVDKTGSVPPVEADMTAGATITATGDFNMQGTYFYSWGVNYVVGDDFSIACGKGIVENSIITLSGVADSVALGVGGTIYFKDMTLVAVSADATIKALSYATMRWDGGSVSGTMNRLVSFWSSGSATANRIYINNVDLSSVSSLVLGSTGLVDSEVVIENCKLKSGYVIDSGALGVNNSNVRIYGSSATASEVYAIHEHDHYGDIIHETTIVKTGGSSDGVTPISLKLVSTANTTEYLFPIRTRIPIEFYTDTIGLQDFSVDVLTDNVVLQDDEAWLELVVPSADTQGANANSLPATVLTAPSNLPTNADAWTTTGIGTPVKQTITVTANVQQAGIVRAYICLARPSTTMYADLKILDGARQYLAGQVYINGEDASTPTQAPEDKVILGTVYNNGNNTGNYKQVPESKGEDGYQWGANGVEFTGELLPLTASYNLPQELIIDDDETIIYEGCNP